MFWSKKTLESEEFRTLFAKFENLRIEVETIKLDLKLYQNKLAKKAGIKLKEEQEEDENKGEPKVLLTPSGVIPR